MADQAPLLHLSDAARDIPFEIHTLEWMQQNRRVQQEAAHRHDYFTLIWVQAGTGLQYIDLDHAPVEEGMVYAIAPGQIHLLKADTGISGIALAFTAEFLCQYEDNYDLLYSSGIFNSYAGASKIAVPPMVQEDLQAVAGQLLKEFGNFFLLRAEILRTYLKLFLLYLTRNFQAADKDAPHTASAKLVRQFLELLEKQYASKKMVTDYARELAVTPNYLNEIIKKKTGLPASDHIRNRVILEAKREAAYADNSMKEIAYRLGFEDLAHFSKYFKNATGSSFTAFRKEIGIR